MTGLFYVGIAALFYAAILLVFAQWHREPPPRGKE